jgi:hypothetical protein
MAEMFELASTGTGTSVTLLPIWYTTGVTGRVTVEVRCTLDGVAPAGASAVAVAGLEIEPAVTSALVVV